MKRGILFFLLLSMVLCPGSVFSQEKPRIGILKFTNSAGWAGIPFQDELKSALVSKGSFKPASIEILNIVLAESDMRGAFKLSEEALARLRNIKNVDYFVACSVSSYEQKSATVKRRRLQKNSNDTADVASILTLDVSIINGETGRVVDARAIEATAKAKGIAAGLNGRHFSAAGADTEKPPTEKAIRAVMAETAEYLNCVLIKGKDNPCMNRWSKRSKTRRDRRRR